jgi:hypothetical protein
MPLVLLSIRNIKMNGMVLDLKNSQLARVTTYFLKTCITQRNERCNKDTHVVLRGQSMNKMTYMLVDSNSFQY